MAIETTGKTIDAAIAAALTQLNADRDSVTVEVLENPKTGFLGIGGTPAKVRVKMLGEPDDVIAAPRAKPAKPVTEKPPKKEVEKPAKKAEKGIAEPSPAPAPKQAAPAAQATPVVAATLPNTQAKPAGVARAAAADGGKPAEVLQGLLERMGIKNAVITAEDTERHLLLNISGANMGRLIGRRGETLDAVQRIVSTACNRGAPERRRIVVDAEQYRAKREEALAALAVSTAEKVVKYNRDMLLEPMNAYSRHVIHTALQDNPYVTTHSVGNEPQRRVIISLSGAKKSANPRSAAPPRRTE